MFPAWQDSAANLGSGLEALVLCGGDEREADVPGDAQIQRSKVREAATEITKIARVHEMSTYNVHCGLTAGSLGMPNPVAMNLPKSVRQGASGAANISQLGCVALV